MFKLPIPTRLTDYLGEAVVWTVISITNVGLILTKLRGFLFSGCGQTDGRTDRQTRFWNPHMETCRHTKNFNSKLKISG